jgi:PTS system cellobiose-specific IIA component
MSEKLSQEMIMIATEVIIHAGNARYSIGEAINALENDQYDHMEAHIQEAENEVTEAHRIQTETLQSEARGEDVYVSFLWVHAQDSLMAAMIELRNFQMMLRMIKKLEKK